MGLFRQTAELQSYWHARTRGDAAPDNAFRTILDLAYDTETGRDAIKWGADLHVTIKHPFFFIKATAWNCNRCLLCTHPKNCIS